MPPPVPLTSTPPAKIDFSKSDAPRSMDFGDIYYSVEGGLAETRENFLQGCSLPEGWAGRKDFTVGELGFGSGLNVLALWQLWRAHRSSMDARLHIVSIEGFPLSREELATALEPWAELRPFADELICKWPGRVKGWHRLDLSDGVSLTLIHDEVLPALNALNIQADAWFLDGFSPAKNPDMWSNEVLTHIGRLSAPGARVGTFTVAGHVRRGLREAGFEVSKQPGFGKKRERLEAIKPGIARNKIRSKNIAIIGAGIAAAMTARALMRQGITPTLIAPEDDWLASGNPRAIVKPRLDLQDRPEARFFNSAYLYALSVYDEIGTAQRGVFHIAKDKKDAARFEQLCAQAALPSEHIKFVAQDYFEKAAGLIAPFGGVYYPQAAIIEPNLIREQTLDGMPRIHDRMTDIENGYVQGLTERYGPFDQIILCIGAGIREHMPDSGLHFQHGQITIAKGRIAQPVTYGGYALPFEDGVLLGATHSRWDGNPPQPLDEYDTENIEGFTSRAAQAGEVRAHRASVRVTTKDTSPKLFRRDENTLVMTGLGGRGFVYAPLLGAQAAAMVTETPEPISPEAIEKFGY